MSRGPKPLQGRTEAIELRGFRKRMAALLKTTTPTQVSRISGLSVSTPIQWTKGIQEPSLRGVGRVVEALGTCLGWITGDGPDYPWRMIFPEQTSKTPSIIGVALPLSFEKQACAGQIKALRAWCFSASGFDRFPSDSILITRPARIDDNDGYYVVVDKKTNSNKVGYLTTDTVSSKRIIKFPQIPDNNFISQQLPKLWVKVAHRVIQVITISDV